MGERSIRAALRVDPRSAGFNATTWTCALLARYLSTRLGTSIGPRTLRRRMHAARLRWKRPRYVLHQRDPHAGSRKGGLKRRLSATAEPDEPVLVADETILRLFPPLRQAWGLRGSQVCVPVTGRNARRVLYGAINVRTGHRVLRRASSMRQGEVHAFLRDLRRRYRAKRRVWLILDQHGSHASVATRKLAKAIGVGLLFLPKQCPELNPMDHLWREAKRMVAANRQYDDIDQEAAAAERWFLWLTPREARRKAGMLSKNFWLIT